MIVNIAQETLSVVVRQRPETQLTFFALLARCDNGRARMQSRDHIKGVSSRARSGAVRALQVAGLVQIAAKGRGWSEYVINTEPMQDQYVTNAEPIQPEAASVLEFESNEDITNTQPMQNQNTTNANPGWFTPDASGPLEMVSDLPTFVDAREVTYSGPMQDQNVTNTEPTPPEAAPVVEFANNEDETNVEPTRNEGMTSAGHEGDGSEDIEALTVLLDKCANETQQRPTNAEPTHNEDITSAEPAQPEPAPILDFCNNKHATNAEPMQDEHKVNSIFLDLDDDPEPLEAIRPGRGMGIRHPSMLATQPMDDEARVEARAREMAVEAWDTADARTFEACEGQFDQFWMCRKRHFMDQAKQELTSETL